MHVVATATMARPARPLDGIRHIDNILGFKRGDTLWTSWLVFCVVDLANVLKLLEDPDAESFFFIKGGRIQVLSDGLDFKSGSILFVDFFPRVFF